MQDASPIILAYGWIIGQPSWRSPQPPPGRAEQFQKITLIRWDAEPIFTVQSPAGTACAEAAVRKATMPIAITNPVWNWRAITSAQRCTQTAAPRFDKLQRVECAKFANLSVCLSRGQAFDSLS